MDGDMKISLKELLNIGKQKLQVLSTPRYIPYFEIFTYRTRPYLFGGHPPRAGLFVTFSIHQSEVMYCGETF